MSLRSKTKPQATKVQAPAVLDAQPHAPPITQNVPAALRYTAPSQAPDANAREPQRQALASPARLAPTGKLGQLVALLRRPEGADLNQMMATTGWQAHSVRGALAGSLTVKHGLKITSEKIESRRIYRLLEQSKEAAQ